MCQANPKFEFIYKNSCYIPGKLRLWFIILLISDPSFRNFSKPVSATSFAKSEDTSNLRKAEVVSPWSITLFRDKNSLISGQ